MFDAIYPLLGCYQVISIPACPQGFEFRIVQKHCGSAWCGRTIFQIVELAVQKQRVLIRVENNGRECVVMMIDDELSRRRGKERVRERSRRKVSIKDYEHQPGCVKEQNHHQTGRQKGTDA